MINFVRLEGHVIGHCIMLLSRLKISTVLCGLIIIPQVSMSQINITSQLDGRINVINTAVPFLRIVPDARSGAMGDVGVAISPDANSIQWNAAKLAFAPTKVAISMTYTPWLRTLVDDIYLAYLAGYVKVDENQAIGSSLRYFSLGNIVFTDIVGNETGQFNPREYTYDFAYARKFTKNFSTGLTLRFIYSNLAAGQVVNNVDITPGVAAAADISVYYQKDVELGTKDGILAFGANISNIGSKITYTKSKEKDFIPTNLGLGSALTIVFNEYNTMMFALDLSKLMVPTPDTAVGSAYKTKGVVSGIFGSFTDAPDGGKEEFNEIMYAGGIEYWYNNQFAARAGYFNEHKLKGNRKYFTLGVGLRYNVFGLNFSYLVPTTGTRNPLDNTLRFSLLFDFANKADD